MGAKRPKSLVQYKDSTRKPGKCLFRMEEIKSTLFSYLTNNKKNFADFQKKIRGFSKFSKIEF